MRERRFSVRRLDRPQAAGLKDRWLSKDLDRNHALGLVHTLTPAGTGFATVGGVIAVAGRLVWVVRGNGRLSSQFGVSLVAPRNLARCLVPVRLGFCRCVLDARML